MRSIKLVPLLTATAALLALAPAGASARRAAAHPHASGPCRAHLEAPKAPIASGEAVTLFGTLSCPQPAQAGGRPITLFEQSAPNAGFTSLPPTTTEANGAFQVTPPLFTTNSVFYAVAEGAQSARRTIRVAAAITPLPPTPVEGAQLFTRSGRARNKRNAVTFAGVVSQQDKGAVVVLQRESATANEEWRAIQRGTVDESGKYAIVHHFLVPGDANLRVVVHPRGINAPSATSPTSYEISQTQNPALTVETSADPLLYGQAATIKGVVAGAPANTPVTLLARNRGGQLTPAASAQTGAGGAYEFAPQTPLTNTIYRVQTATAKSALLFEGVKYALTVAPTVGTVPAGQPVMFSGSVQPALVGHAVYVERQGAARLGWRVVDVGTVGAPAKAGEAAPFSITHTFYSPGALHLRVKIPGDPGNQSAAGAPSEVTVTPVPASALAPEAPGNTKLPGEGQL
jgi:hypothetical protein